MLESILSGDSPIKSPSQVDSQPMSYLYILLIASIVIIVVLAVFILILLLGRNKTDKYRNKEKILAETSIDYDNIIGSSFKAKELYDELKVKCHPDRFTDIEMQQKATEIFQQLVRYKYDYKKLAELKEMSKNTLNIKF